MLGQLEARPYRGFDGIRSYFQDVDVTWDEWRVEVEQLLSAPDGRVVIVAGAGGGDDRGGLEHADLHRVHADVLGDRAYLVDNRLRR